MLLGKNNIDFYQSAVIQEFTVAAKGVIQK